MERSTLSTTYISPILVFMLAAVCGATVANLYYAQTLVLWIGADLHIPSSLTGLIVTFTQIGYGVGLLFLVPLGDFMENRRLICGLLCILSVALIGVLLAHNNAVFLLSCFVLGIPVVAAQVIVPFAAHFTAEEKRGRVVGNIVSGILFGILLSRPISSWLAASFSWRAIFACSLVLMLSLSILLRFLLPQRQPHHQLSYPQLLRSLPVLFKRYAILRRRATYQAFLFGAFSLFWTSVAMVLAETFHYSQREIALFAFAGAAGAVCAPLAGRMADRGWTKPATGIALALTIVAFILAKWLDSHSVAALIIAALLLDAGVSCSMVVGQRAVFSLSVEERGRLNALYMTIFFMGGAVGSALAGYAYVQGGWSRVTDIGLVAMIIAFIYFLTERN